MIPTPPADADRRAADTGTRNEAVAPRGGSLGLRSALTFVHRAMIGGVAGEGAQSVEVFGDEAFAGVDAHGEERRRGGAEFAA